VSWDPPPPPHPQQLWQPAPGLPVASLGTFLVATPTACCLSAQLVTLHCPTHLHLHSLCPYLPQPLHPHFTPPAHQGYPPLQAWAGELTHRLQRPAAPVDLLITPGATAALDAVTRLLLDPGDPLVVEEFTYSHALEALFVPARYELLTVPLDDQGLVPEALDTMLEERAAAGLKMPRVLYTIPTGRRWGGWAPPPGGGGGGGGGGRGSAPEGM
jgi:hypothetical protein